LVALVAGPSGAWELVIGGHCNGRDGGHCPWRGAARRHGGARRHAGVVVAAGPWPRGLQAAEPG